jgi:hypothetical protein
MTQSFPIDLVALVPGKDDREALAGLIETRQASLGIRAIRAELLVHPRRDPGCFHEAPAVLQSYQRRAHYALVIFDHEGCGQEARPAPELERELEERLSNSGWPARAKALVIEPELEVWVWSDSPQVDVALGWQGRSPHLRRWLADNLHWPAGPPKPARPKETLDAALREAGVRRSSSIFRQLAETVSLERCRDAKFLQLKQLLTLWFPERPQT